MKRIAFIVSSLDCGGAQRAVANISLAIPQEYEVDIILNNDDHIVYPYRGRIISVNLKNPRNRDNLLFQLKLFLRRVSLLKKIKKENGYCAVISFLHSSNIANIISGNKYCKTIISVRTNMSKERDWVKKILINSTAKIFYNKADKIVTLSNGVEEDLINNHGIVKEKIKTIYNCYDLESIINLSKKDIKIKIDKNCTNYVTMGRLTDAKGQWHLIRAFSEVIKNNKTAKLYILGEGELFDYLNKIIRLLKLEKSVILCGFVENPYAVLEKMDIFIFASLFEGFGNALLESMIVGLPCISTDFESGAREIFQDVPLKENSCKNIEYLDYGVLIPVPDGEKYTDEPLTKEELIMAKSMIEMGNNKEMRENYSQKSIQRASMFDSEMIWSEWEKVI